MGFFIFILFTLLLFLLIILIGSTMQFSITICTGKKIEFEQTILPSFLSLVSFSVIIFITSMILAKYNINIVELMYMFVLNLDFTFNHLIYAAFTYLGACLLFTIIQAFYIKLIYINYTKIFRNIKDSVLFIFGIKRIKKLCAPSDTNDEPLSKVLVNSISFLNSYLSSLLSVALLFFICILFMFLGTTIGDKFI